MVRSVSFTALLLAAALVPIAAAAQEEPPQPRVAVAIPLAVEPGAVTKLTLRGWKLDAASEVKSVAGVEVKIASKGNAPVPGGQEAKTIGDQQLEIEITVPAEFEAAELPLTVVAPAGESTPYQVLVGGEFVRLEEKEENDGFRNAQSVEVPQIVAGQIHGDRNVDVFAFTAQSGQRLTAEVIARRRGSALDGILTLYDAQLNVIAIADDAQGVDPLLEFAIEENGRYFLSLQDAHDQGGPAHVYRLILRPAAQ